MATPFNDGHDLSAILLPKPAQAGVQPGPFLVRRQH